MDVDSLIENIADIESRTFSDAWSEESITDSMEQDYNVLFVAYVLEDDVRIKTIIGGPDYDKQNDMHIAINKDNFVDEVDYAFAGYLMANIIIDESELLRIAVSSELQRRGIGRSLMMEYFEYIKPYCKRSILEVRQSNIKASQDPKLRATMRTNMRASKYPQNMRKTKGPNFRETNAISEIVP